MRYEHRRRGARQAVGIGRSRRTSIISAATSEPIEKGLIDDADLVVADGMPLIWASRLAGEPLPERVSGSSMVWSICEAASARGQSVFLLGGDPGVAERAAEVFRQSLPGPRDRRHGVPSRRFRERRSGSSSAFSARSTEAAPRIVFVALGFPKQDLLIRILRSSLPHASFLGVGISLSYATGDVSRPPGWICRLGLEWAYRLSQEPTRRSPAAISWTACHLACD